MRIQLIDRRINAARTSTPRFAYACKREGPVFHHFYYVERAGRWLPAQCDTRAQGDPPVLRRTVEEADAQGEKIVALAVAGAHKMRPEDAAVCWWMGRDDLRAQIREGKL
jgi:hypothetical protein